MEAVKIVSDDLFLILEQELRLVGDLIGYAQEKEAFLIASDVDSLNGVLMKEEETVVVLREKEVERKERTTALADVLGISGENLTLKKLAEHIRDPGCRQRLVSDGNKMGMAMRRLSRHNAKVKELLKHQIRYTGFMLNLLYSPQRANFYNMQGNRDDKVSHESRLDYHA